VVPQILAVYGLSCRCDDVCDQPKIAGFGLATDHLAPRHCRMRIQHGGDLCELDALTPHLHLGVETAEELVLVSGRAVDDIDVSVHRRGRVEHIETSAGDRATDAGRVAGFGVRRDEARGRHDSALGDAVVVDQRERGPGTRSPVKHVTTREHAPECDIVRPRQVEQRLGQRRGNERQGDVRCHQPVTQSLGHHDDVRRGDMELGASRQVRPQLPDRRVERRVRDDRRAIGRLDLERLMMPIDETQQVSVRDLDALRRAGRTRRVDHVRRVVGVDESLRDVAARLEEDLLLLEIKQLCARRPEELDRRTVCEQYRHLSVAQDELEAGLGMSRIHCNVRRAGLEYREKSDDIDRRPIVTDADPNSGAHPERLEALRERVRSSVELAVRQQ
jgi:hypothetical protein